MIFGEMDVARVNPYRSGQSELVHWSGTSAHGLVCIPPASDGHPIPGGDSRSSSCPVDDVHQAGSHRALWRRHFVSLCQIFNYFN